MRDLDQLTVLKSRVLLELEGAKIRGDKGEIERLAKQGVDFEVEIAGQYESVGRKQDAAISLVSAASCLLDLDRRAEATDYYCRAESLSSGILRDRIRDELRKLQLASDEPQQPHATCEDSWDLFHDQQEKPLPHSERFKFIKLIGEGGQGQVYLAEDLVESQTVAVKVLKGGAQRLDHVRNEITAARQVPDERVRRYYSVYPEGDDILVSMEYLPGRTLDTMIPELQGDQPRAREYGKEIALGLKAIHEKGVIHCDLKPKNIIVTDKDQIRILDFGLSRPAGVPEGTRHFIPPEYFEQPGAQRDIYSFGITLHQMLLGRVPSAEELAAERFDLKLLDRRVVSRCLRREPQRRYQNGTELVDGLEYRQERRALIGGAVACLFAFSVLGVIVIRHDIDLGPVDLTPQEARAQQTYLEGKKIQSASPIKALSLYREAEALAPKTIEFVSTVAETCAIVARDQKDLMRDCVEQSLKAVKIASESYGPLWRAACFVVPGWVDTGGTCKKKQMNRARALFARAFVLGEGENPESALTAVGMGLSINDSYPAAHRTRLRALLMLGRLDDARKEVAWLEKNGTKDWNSKLRIAGFYRETGEVRKAIEILQGLSVERPGQWEVHQSLGSLYLMQNRIEDARAELMRARGGTPQSKPDIESALGMLHFLTGDFLRSRESYRAVLTVPGLPDGIRLQILPDYADVLRALADGTAAREMYEETVRLGGSALSVLEANKDFSQYSIARMKTLVALSYAKLGTCNLAVERLEDAEKKGGSINRWHAAVVYSRCGPRFRAQESVRLLEAQGWSPEILKRDPEIRDLFTNGAGPAR